jgi:hypothetical protein
MPGSCRPVRPLAATWPGFQGAAAPSLFRPPPESAAGVADLPDQTSRAATSFGHCVWIVTPAIRWLRDRLQWSVRGARVTWRSMSGVWPRCAPTAQVGKGGDSRVRSARPGRRGCQAVTFEAVRVPAPGRAGCGRHGRGAGLEPLANDVARAVRALRLAGVSAPASGTTWCRGDGFGTSRPDFFGDDAFSTPWWTTMEVCHRRSEDPRKASTIRRRRSRTG